MTTRPPGRPRSETARRAVLDATVALVSRDGYGRVTMEGIAREAGVSKQTVYRWWPSKAAIVLEALNEGASAIAPLEETGVLEDDLRTFVRRSVRGGGGASGRLLAALMAESQLDPGFAASFRTEFLARRRAVLRELLDRAAARGDIAAGADLELAVELVFAALWYRILTARPLTRGFADGLTDAVLAQLSAPRADG